MLQRRPRAPLPLCGFTCRRCGSSAFAVVAILVNGVAFAASYLPAHRTAKADPVIALRQD
jgi:hypothetical protein